jgi:hypothetical protein
MDCNQARDEKRAGHAACLIEGSVQAKGPPGAGPARRMRQHRTADRCADCPAYALSDQQQHRRRPNPGKRERGHGQKIDQVAGDHDRPVAAPAIGSSAGQVADPVSEELAETGDDADHQSGSPQRAEKRTGNAAAAFIGHIREQADAADQDDEGDRLPPILCGQLSHLCRSR